MAILLSLTAPSTVRAEWIFGPAQRSSSPSIGYSLKQLAARSAAKQGSDGKSWRYLGRHGVDGLMRKLLSRPE